MQVAYIPSKPFDKVYANHMYILETFRLASHE